MIQQFDDFLHKQVQQVYTFIWNRFGITRGSICASLILIITLTVSIRVSNTGFAFTVMLLALFYIAYINIGYHNLQVKGMYKQLNKKALDIKKGIISIGLRTIVACGILYAIFNKPTFTLFLVDVPFLLVLYLETCLVQDRELPEQKTEYSHGY